MACVFCVSTVNVTEAPSQSTCCRTRQFRIACVGDADESDQQQDGGAPDVLEAEQRSVEVARATRRGVRIADIEAREARREVRHMCMVVTGHYLSCPLVGFRLQ